MLTKKIKETIMNRWEDVVNEVLNKSKKSSRRSPTNLNKTTLRRSIAKRAKKTKHKKEKKMYHLGNDYPGVYFTKREAECMLLLLRNHTINSAAGILQLSPRTVEFYVKNMKVKTESLSKIELIKKVKESEFLKSIDFDVNEINT